MVTRAYVPITWRCRDAIPSLSFRYVACRIGVAIFGTSIARRRGEHNPYQQMCTKDLDRGLRVGRYGPCAIRFTPRDKPTEAGSGGVVQARGRRAEGQVTGNSTVSGIGRGPVIQEEAVARQHNVRQRMKRHQGTFHGREVHERSPDEPQRRHSRPSEGYSLQVLPLLMQLTTRFMIFCDMTFAKSSWSVAGSWSSAGNESTLY